MIPRRPKFYPIFRESHDSALGTFRRRFGRLILTILVAGFLGFMLYWAGSRIFTIRKIEIVGQNILVVIDEKRISRNIIFFPTETIRREILSENPILKDVRFEKIYPGTLRIVPQIRDAIAVLYAKDRIAALARDGVVLGYGDPGKNLPRIIVDVDVLRVGQAINNPKVSAALASIEVLSRQMEIREIIEHDESSIRVKTDKIDIIIVQDKSVSDTLSTLQMLLAGFRIKGTLPAVVDLRFDKPIITY